MSDYNRIAKNTIYLYIRTFFTIVIGLYSSRVFLNALGAEDYGLYNVVAGFVALFAIVTSSFTSSIGRHITYELGKGDPKKLEEVFSTCFVVLAGFAILIMLIGETLGLWFLYNELNIPPDRFNAAFWCFQLSLLSFATSMLMVPFSACIGAHEHFGIAALFSFLDMGFKLIICFIVMYNPIDRLVFYALLFFLSGMITMALNFYYCRSHFPETHFRIVFKPRLLKDIFSFAGWNLIGTGAFMLRGQGSNILINIFFGPIANTANAFAAVLAGMATKLESGFTISLAPQITKSYAAERYDDLLNLLHRGAKLSYYLVLIGAIPVILNCRFVLELWLGQVPEHTVNLVRLSLALSLVEVVTIPLIKARNATGRIRNFELTNGLVLLMVVPLGYIGFKLGASVEWMYMSSLIIAIPCFIIRLNTLKGEIPGWSRWKFFKNVCLRNLVVSTVAIVPPLLVYINLDYGWINLILTSAASLMSSIATIYFLGLNANERIFMISFIRKFIGKFQRIFPIKGFQKRTAVD